MIAAQNGTSRKHSRRILHISNVLIRESKSFSSLSLGILKGNRAGTSKKCRGTNLATQNSEGTFHKS